MMLYAGNAMAAGGAVAYYLTKDGRADSGDNLLFYIITVLALIVIGGYTFIAARSKDK